MMYQFSWRTALISALLAFGVFGAVRFLFGSFFDPGVRAFGPLIGLPLGAFAAGYWAGQQPGGRAMQYALFATGVLLLAAYLFRALPDNAVSLLLALAGGPLGALLAARGGFGALGLNVKLPQRENALFDQLLMRVRQDRYMAERLIEFERRRSPNAPRARLIQDAIDRLDRDRR